MTFMLLEHFDEVFSGSEMEITEHVKDLFQKLRQTRPAFVNNEAQLKIAIINAIQLKEYEMELRGGEISGGDRHKS